MNTSTILKRFIFCEDGRIEVRANSVADLKITLKELKLLKKEYRLQKKDASARARNSIPFIRKAVRAGISVEGYPADPSVPPVLRTQKFEQDVAELEAGIRAFDGLIRLVEEVELKVEAAILGTQG